MGMQQLIYASRPTEFSNDAFATILTVATTMNARHNITGALICRPDLYLQLLEGPVHGVEKLFCNIMRDQRHSDAEILVRCKVGDRLFPDWSMWHHPVQSWLWLPDEIDSGALRRANARDVRAIFVRVANAV